MSSKDLKHVDKASLTLRASGLQVFAIIALLLGIIGLAAGFYVKEPTRVWGSLIFNTWYFFCFSLGAMVLQAITDVIGATWNRPIRRIQEGFGSFVPWAVAIFFLILLAIGFNLLEAGKVYSWIADPHSLHHFWGKRTWLQAPLFYGRTVIFLLIILALVLWQLRSALRRDRAWMEGRYDEAAELAHEFRTKARFWSAPILIVYGITFTFVAFDITMSLAPTWFSTLWGGWSFSVMMQTLMALTLLFMFALRNHPIGAFISRQQFHDVGKLMHGFTVFFGYLTFAHILTYWYGNMPEETEYFLHRLHGPWVYLLFVVFFLGFVIPLYTLIPRAAKWTAGWTMPVAIIILIAQWCTNIILVMPQVSSGESFKLPFVEFAGFFFLLGLFLLSFVSFGRKNPMLPVGDPLLEEALNAGHH